MTRAAIAFTVLFGAAILGLLVVQRPLPMPVPPPTVPALTPYGTMAGIVDPSSMALFDAVGIEVTTAGTVETAPHTDADWAALERSALTLAEAGNLVKMVNRHVASPELMDSKGSDPTALVPRQIEEKIAKDPAAFAKYADALSATAVEAMTFAKAKDVEGLGHTIEAIDKACENCHKVFWYPDEP